MLDLFSRHYEPDWNNELYECHGWGMFDRNVEAIKYRNLARLKSLDLIFMALLVGSPLGFLVALMGWGDILFYTICLLTCVVLVGIAYIKGAEDTINQYLDNLEGDYFDKE